MKDKIRELDILSGLAIIMVILIHANRFYVKSVLELNSYLEGGFWVNILDNLIWASVPIFIFIAGYKYYQNNIIKNRSRHQFIKKQIHKVFIPFLIISLIFIILEGTLIYLFGESEFLLLHSLKRFCKIFLGYNIAYQLWYVPLYFFIIILYPIIYRYIRNDYYRFILLTLLSVLVLSNGLLSYPVKFSYYILFFDMGVIFNKYQIHKKIKFGYIFILMLVTLLLCVMNKNPELDVYMKHLILNPILVIFYWKLSFVVVNINMFYFLGLYSFYIFLFHEPIIVRRV